MYTFPQLIENCRQSRLLASKINAQSSFGNFTFVHRRQSIRLYALGRCGDANENKLLYVDIPYPNNNSDNSGTENDNRLIWKPLHEMNSTVSQNMSKEEELLRQRLRMLIGGICSYTYHAESSRFLFSSNSRLFELSDVGEAGSPELKPVESITETQGAPMDPKFCPTNPNFISFILQDDLYVRNGDTVQRLTFTQTEEMKAQGKVLTAGVASYIIQEEFERYTGYWWCPVEHGENYYILFEENDSSKVENISLTESESMHYPRPGKNNARWDLKMLQITLQNDPATGKKVMTTKILNCDHELRNFYPWAEYLVRVGWMPNGKYIWFQVMSRLQNESALIQVSLDSFIRNRENRATPNGQIFALYKQVSPLWIKDHNSFTVLNQTEQFVKFIWCHNETDYDHLYLVESKYPRPSANRENSSVSLCLAINEAECLVAESALTKGPYNVSRKGALHLDRGRELVYFLASKETPLETHIYCASYGEVTDAKRLTQLGYSYGSMREAKPFYFSEQNDFFVVCRSSLTEIGQCLVYSLSQNIAAPYLPDAHLLYVVSGHRDLVVDCSPSLATVMNAGEQSSEKPIKSVEIFSYDSPRTSFKHFACLWRPEPFCQGKNYPTILHIYGGPEVQMVRNSHMGNMNMRKYTRLGYAVVMIDGRGSANRSMEFEKPVMGNMGLFELEDQIEVLEFVSNEAKCIDMSRIAIIGWSYGGYMALMGIAQKKNVFKVGVAGAPVTDWLLYDTGYTERYMGLPLENAHYSRSAVQSFVSGFPDEPGRVLILHGLLDENVHFQHTAKLIEALVKAGKPHQLQIYPNERHAIRSFETILHMDATVLAFLQTNL